MPQKCGDCRNAGSRAWITDLHRDTIMRLLVLCGEKCAAMFGKLVVNVPVEDVQCDEIRGYVFKKEAHKLPMEAHNNSIGDAYTSVGIERNSKLVCSEFRIRAARSSHHGYFHRRGTRCDRTGTVPDHHGWIPALRLGDHHDAFRPLRFRPTHQGLCHLNGRRASLFPARRCGGATKTDHG